MDKKEFITTMEKLLKIIESFYFEYNKAQCPICGNGHLYISKEFFFEYKIRSYATCTNSKCNAKFEFSPVLYG